MSRVYTVKSNARRDARKLGLDPETVKSVAGGFVIDYPDVKIEKLVKPKAPKAEKKAKAPKAAKPACQKSPRAAKPPKPPKATKEPKANKPPRAKREGDPKRDRLMAMLADWTPIGDLMSAFGWLPHTTRSAISTGAKALGVTIERQRVDGVTSYRVAPEAEAKAA